MLVSFLLLPISSAVAADTRIENFGSKYVFNSSWSIQVATAPLSANKYVIVFCDTVYGDRGVAMVANVSGRSITYGPKTVFDADPSYYMSVAAINSTHFSIAYDDGGNSDKGTIITGTVGGGDAITFTSSQAFSTGASANIALSLLNYDIGSDTGWLVVAYDEGNSGGNGTASIVSVVGNGSTTTIGAPVTFNAARVYWVDIGTLSASSFLVVFTDHGNSDHGTAMAATVAGYVPTFGAEFEYNASFTSGSRMAVLTSSKAVVIYNADGAPMHGRSKILSVSGTVVSGGTAANVHNPDIAVSMDDVIALSSDTFIVAYMIDPSNGNLTRLGTVSGTNITYDDMHYYSNPLVGMSSLTFLSATKFVISYCDADNSNYGTSMVADLPFFLHPIGTLIYTGSPYDPASAYVYRVTDTHEKSWIPNPTVFGSQFPWEKIVPVSYSEMVDYSVDGGYYPYRDGEIVKELNNPAVYIFAGGQKRHITTPQVYNQYHFSWGNIVLVPDFSLLNYADGADLAIYADNTYPEGSLLKASNDNKVYYISAGQKRFIPTGEVYLTRFFSWAKIITVDPTVLSDANYPVGSALPYRDGEIVKESSNPAVYVFESGLKRHILTLETFATYNYSWSNLVIAQDGSLAAYGDGSDLTI